MEATRKGTYETEREKLLKMVVEDSLEGKVDYEFDTADTAESKLHQQAVEMVVEDLVEEGVEEPRERQIVLDIDLNLPADIGFDLNKFADEEDLTPKEEAARACMKIYLPSFY